MITLTGLTPDDLCLSIDDGIYGEVADATKHKRASAMARYASEAGCSFNEVHCRKRYCRIYTQQEAWDSYGRDRYLDEWEYHFCADNGREPTLEEADAAIPGYPPPDWRPRDDDPCWGFVRRDVPGALPIWVCETKVTQ